MRRSQAANAAVRTARRWVSERTERNAGQESHVALDISQLISPLRLDVLVRASLFEAWAADWDNLADRPHEALRLAQQQDYRRWFDLVAKDKITGGSTSSAEEAFVWRVKRSHALFARYMHVGFDERYPITVKLHLGGELPSGKTMSPRLYPVDGCHRLALLWIGGARRLEPTHYRLLTDQSAPRDNTAALLPELKLTESDYYRFIGSGYGVPETQTKNELMTAVPDDDPRHAELLSVLTADEAVR